MIKRLRNIVFEKGFLLCLGLSLLYLVIAYGKLLPHPNSTYFSADGDGLQSYYGAIYHVKHDTSWWRTSSMHYPYGEQVFYTGCQPLVTNPIKLISKVVDISGYTVGILNCIMLFSIVLCSLSLYLIFRHLKMNWILSAIASVAIAFLSPQMARLGGHFSLTYEFAFPMLVLGLMKFNEKPSMKRSLAIGLLTLFIAGTHFYFFGFFALLSAVYWGCVFISERKLPGKLLWVLKHFTIQLLLPFLILQFIMLLTDPVTDRTAFPAGYITYSTNLTGVFFPTMRFYTPFFESFILPEYPEWEGAAYVGLVAVVMTVLITLQAILKIFKRQFKALLSVTGQPFLNILFWASVAGLLLSFAYPFKWPHCYQLFVYSGPLKQLRGIGRFSWMFYYAINIIAFYKIHRLMEGQRKTLAYLAAVGALLFIAYDSWVMNYDRQKWYNNKIAELSDPANELPTDQWLKTIDPSDYQAIVSLPYFHGGDENVWVWTSSDIFRDVFVACIKTGLPTTSSILSRTSISQSFKNIALIKEPYRRLDLLEDLKSRKPFLVLVREKDLGPDDSRLLSRCTKRMETPNFGVYELKTETLEHISDSLYSEAFIQFTKERTFRQGKLLSTDSLNTVVYLDYENLQSAGAHDGSGAREGMLLDHTTLFNDTLPGLKDEDYVVSFWIDHFTTDLYPRAVVELICTDPSGKGYASDFFRLDERLRIVHGHWALLEDHFRLKNRGDKLVLNIWTDNFLDKKMQLRVDDLLIRPAGTRVYKNVGKDSLTINNRTYLANQK